MTYQYVPQYIYKNILKEKTMSAATVWVIAQHFSDKFSEVPPDYKENYFLCAEGLFKSSGKTYQYLSEDNKKKLALLAFKLEPTNISYMNNVEEEEALKMLEALANMVKKQRENIGAQDLRKSPTSVEEHIELALEPSANIYYEKASPGARGLNSNIGQIMKDLMLSCPSLKNSKTAFSVIAPVLPYLCNQFSTNIHADTNFMKPFLIEYPHFMLCTPQLKCDSAFFKELLDNSPSLTIFLEHFSTDISGNKGFMLQLLRKNINYIYSYKYMSEELKRDTDILGTIFKLINIQNNDKTKYLNYIMGEIPKDKLVLLFTEEERDNNKLLENKINILIEKSEINNNLSQVIEKQPVLKL